MIRRALSLSLLALAACGSDGTTPTVTTAPHCPAGAFGGAMVAVPAKDGSSYCVDATEVTNDAYAAFLVTSPGMDALDPSCAEFLAKKIDPKPPFDLSDFTPQFDWPPADDRGAYPVHAVTWCDAASFCKANGKRLCGEVGGGPLRDPWDPMDTEDVSPSTNEWLSACTRGGARVYPYGDTFEKGRCVATGGTLADLSVPAGDPSCEGGYDGLFDMLGDLYEYVDSCGLDVDAVMMASGESPGCTIVGGADAAEGPDDPTSTCATEKSSNFELGDVDVGIRCCADLAE